MIDSAAAEAPVGPDADSEQELIGLLAAIAGKDAVLTDEAARVFFSTDIASRGATAEAVVKVAELPILRQVVAAATSHGRIVIPRGGGFSYTGGYTPQSKRSVIVDLRPMDRILEINERDMFVVVEVGCTWHRLYEALKAKGLRTPYFGPMSGYRATVGGALSQGSLFLGSTQYGTTADSVLALEVVLADGTVLKTGSWASTQGVPPYFRQYGPDATGLFLNDTGAMGFKTKAALRLIPFPPHQAYASFALTGHAQVTQAVSAIGRSGLAAECYCWDPYFVRMMSVASTGTKQDLHFLWNIVKSGSGPIDGVLAAVRVAFAGKRVFSGETYLLHVVIDDVSAAGAAERLRQVRRLARAAGGLEVAPSAPRALRGTPFTDFNVPERRVKRRNLPIHSLSPHSRAPSVAADVYAFIERRAEEMQRQNVGCGVIFFAVGQQAICIESLIYWEDDEHFLHDRIAEKSDLQALAAYAERSPATRLAFELRAGIKAIFRRHGCLHVQIGRSYPWAETREPATLELLTAVKNSLDPKRLVNRGVLGFGAPGD
jgi:FAD/FMN-containing dehydrogenase